MTREFARLTNALALIFCLVLVLSLFVLLIVQYPSLFQKNVSDEKKEVEFWKAPAINTVPANDDGKLILYGRELIVKTANYLGPQGTVANISNGMNCQNCHLEGGTKVFGNNYGSVASTYPKFRARSGKIESIEKRINDCLERSLNGNALDSLSREMRAMVAYIKWIGKDVPKGKSAAGSGLMDMDWLKRQANPMKGKKLYLQKCQICHGFSGEGQRLTVGGPFIYPPLWGEHSFNTGAGLYRISLFSRYIYANMPNGATYKNPLLTQEEAWDIAAYVVSLPRPEKDHRLDWPVTKLKPVDYPFGPYTDKFSEEQHKFGPFEDILAESK